MMPDHTQPITPPLDTAFITDTGITVGRNILGDPEHNPKQLIHHPKFQYEYIITYSAGSLETPPGKVCDRLDKLTPILVRNKTTNSFLDDSRKNVRYDIKQAEKLSDLEFRCSVGPCDQIYEMHKNFENQSNRKAWAPEEINSLIKFFAVYKNIPIALTAGFRSHRVFRVTHINSIRMNGDYDPKLVGRVSKWLIKQICDYLACQQIDFIDLGIVNFDDDRKQGVTMFKLGFTKTILKTNIFRIYESQKIKDQIELLRHINGRYIH